MSTNKERRRQNIEKRRWRRIRRQREIERERERQRILITRPLTKAEAKNLRKGERPFGTTIRRNVEGINIFISCHGDIASPDMLASYGEPDRIEVPANTTYHFYTEPGQTFYGCNGWDAQQVEQCNYIMNHGVYATGINFSLSANHNIPNFVISAEPDQRKFMSRVVVCLQNPDGTTRLLKLFDIHEHLENSWATIFLPSPTAHFLSFQNKFVPFLTLRELVSRISEGVSQLQAEARQNGGSDHVHYHCMFCQAGTVPDFWKKERRSVIDADRALIQAQTQRRLGPPGQGAGPPGQGAGPQGQGAGPSTPLRYIGDQTSIRYQEPLSADRIARMRDETKESPIGTLTTYRGQGAVSQLNRTFSIRSAAREARIQAQEARIQARMQARIQARIQAQEDQAREAQAQARSQAAEGEGPSDVQFREWGDPNLI